MKIALIQMTSGIDQVANAAVLQDAVQVAAEQGAAMLFTPEMAGLLDRNRERSAASITEEANDAVLRVVQDAALRHKIWVQLGSLAIRRSDGRFANRAFVIDDAGLIRARYDKIHLFDVDLPTGESWRESAAYAPGEEAVIASTPAGVLGLSICYDLRFPALFQALSAAGADIISIPAAFTRPTGEAHWHVLMRARAIESATFVVAAAQTGTHEDGRLTYGHSLVVDPWGEVLLDMGQEAGVAVVEINLARIAEVRARIPVIAHRRAIPPVHVAG